MNVTITKDRHMPGSYVPIQIERNKRNREMYRYFRAGGHRIAIRHRGELNGVAVRSVIILEKKAVPIHIQYTQMKLGRVPTREEVSRRSLQVREIDVNEETKERFEIYDLANS